jgi:ABC-type uncharacterized transport system permease subunit
VCPINIPLLAAMAVAYVPISLENLSGLFTEKITVLRILPC